MLETVLSLKKLFALGEAPGASRLWTVKYLRAVVRGAFSRRFGHYDRSWIEMPDQLPDNETAGCVGTSVAPPCPVCFITDRKYLFPTLIAVHSLLNSAVGKKTGPIHILCLGLTEAELAALQKLPDISVAVPSQPAMERIKEIAYVTVTSLRKCDLPELFPDYDRILYLDSDILIRRDISPLSAVDFKGAYAAAVIDPIATLRGYAQLRLGTKVYVNSGVMLLNLKQMRFENISGKLREAKRREKTPFYMDQDSFNTVFDGHLLLLPPEYNWMPGNLEYYRIKPRQVAALYGMDESKFPLLPRILHYTNAFKPWNGRSSSKFSELWRKEAELTGKWLAEKGLTALLPPELS